MSYYKHITYFTNRNRIALLMSFLKLAKDYYENSTYSWYTDSTMEQPKAKQVRSEINRILDKSREAILSTRIPIYIRRHPAPAVGGFLQDIDLLNNMFGQYANGELSEYLFDCIERSIGKYEHDRTASIIRTVNPFFWLNKIIMIIVSIPFKIIGKFGFNQEKAEASIPGRISQFILYIATIATLIASVIYILDAFGKWDKTLILIDKVMNH